MRRNDHAGTDHAGCDRAEHEHASAASHPGPVRHSVGADDRR
jgi:hypothetical protein